MQDRHLGANLELGRHRQGAAKSSVGGNSLLLWTAAMVIGHCLAKSLYDAAQFCLLLDIMLLAIGLWTSNGYDWEDEIDEYKTRINYVTLGACLGLPAAGVFKLEYSGSVHVVNVSLGLALCSAVVFIYSWTAEWAYAAKVSEMEKYGEVEKCEIPRPPPEGEEVPDYVTMIFVKYKEVGSAIKAQVELEGRTFGGKAVACNFFFFNVFG